MKPWMRRLIDLEKKATLLYAQGDLDEWIKEHLKDSALTYFDMAFLVPDHLKMICLDRGLKELREMQVTRSKEAEERSS
jgi:hypothetical protein